MKFLMNFASGKENNKEIEINSLEELKTLADKEKCGLILRFANDFGGKYVSYEIPHITIYDDYIE
jgi:hypothetical protein